MNKKIIVTAVLIVVAVVVYACLPKADKSNNKKETAVTAGTENGIQFIESNWNKALLEAKKQNKLIFLDAYASWCGPCKLLKRNTFPNKAAGDFFNKNFINVAIDMEKGDGPALAGKFSVRAYPTLIIADANGNMITYTEGFINPTELISFGMHGISKNKN